MCQPRLVREAGRGPDVGLEPTDARPLCVGVLEGLRNAIAEASLAGVFWEVRDASVRRWVKLATGFPAHSTFLLSRHATPQHYIALTCVDFHWYQSVLTVTEKRSKAVSMSRGKLLPVSYK